MAYVFAICEGEELTDPVETVSGFMEAVDRAEEKTQETGKVYSVFPLKVHDGPSVGVH